MNLVVYSQSEPYNNFMRGSAQITIEFRNQLVIPEKQTQQIHLLHITSLGRKCQTWLNTLTQYDAIPVVVCSDQPSAREMIEMVDLGAKAYCNSYMQLTHYHQMVRLLSTGQSWFPPYLLDRVFSLAANNIKQTQDKEVKLTALTKREKEVTLSVSKGLTNREIASQLNVSERTVKSHLGSIFKKLELKDRVALILYLT